MNLILPALRENSEEYDGSVSFLAAYDARKASRVSADAVCGLSSKGESWLA